MSIAIQTQYKAYSMAEQQQRKQSQSLKVDTPPEDKPTDQPISDGSKNSYVEIPYCLRTDKISSNPGGTPTYTNSSRTVETMCFQNVATKVVRCTRSIRAEGYVSIHNCDTFARRNSAALQRRYVFC
jgi:hypothetical protein